MSETMLATLTANPKALVGELPGAQEWADQFFGKPVTLDPEQPLLGQIAVLSKSNATPDVATWDPYDEGYDQGPEDLKDCWHTDDYCSNGQFSGTTVDGAKDLLGALSAVLFNEDVSVEDVYTEFAVLAATAGDWVAPESQDKRDTRLSRRIRSDWAMLSPAARAVLLSELEP